MAKVIELKSMPFDSHEIYDEETGTTSFDRVAYSKDLADWMQNYFSNGILVKGSKVIGNELKVTHTAGLNLSVAPGEIIINGRTGWVETATILNVDIGGSQPRIDRIVMELNLSDRYIYLKVLKGIEAETPEAPTLTQTEDLYQIPLAQVKIDAETATIASVTDEREQYISSVTIGIERPTANSAEAVSVSEEVQELINAENVDDALNIIATKENSTEIGHVFTPSEIVGYNAATIANYFKKKDEIIVDESMFALDFYDASDNNNECVRTGISPDGKNIIEFFRVSQPSGGYYVHICHTHITEDGKIERYEPISTNIRVDTSDSYINIQDMDNDHCIFVAYYNKTCTYRYHYSSKNIIQIAEIGDVNNMIEGGRGFGNASAVLMDSNKKILHFHIHSNNYNLFFYGKSGGSCACAYNKINNSYKEIKSFDTAYNVKSHVKIFKTPIGIGSLKRQNQTVDSTTHQTVHFSIEDLEGNNVVSQTLSDYIYSGSDSVFDSMSYGCWGNEDTFYIALKDTKTKDSVETVTDGTGIYKISKNSESEYVCTKISTTVQPNYYRVSRIDFDTVETSMLHTPEGTPYLTNTALYHSDLYDKLLTSNGVALSETYRDKISEYKAVPFYDLPLSDDAVASATALTTLTPMERESTCTLGMVRKLGNTDWYMGNSIDLIKWFLFKFDESKLIPIKI